MLPELWCLKPSSQTSFPPTPHPTPEKKKQNKNTIKQGLIPHILVFGSYKIYNMVGQYIGDWETQARMQCSKEVMWTVAQIHFCQSLVWELGLS